MSPFSRFFVAFCSVNAVAGCGFFMAFWVNHSTQKDIGYACFLGFVVLALVSIFLTIIVNIIADINDNSGWAIYFCYLFAGLAGISAYFTGNPALSLVEFSALLTIPACMLPMLWLLVTLAQG